MMVPDSHLAYVDRSKITDHLVCAAHPDGRGMADFFMCFGFKPTAWEMLARALRVVGVSNPAVSVVESEYGRRYPVDGPLEAPDRRTPMVRTIWIVERGNSPRLVTAYPL